MSVADLTDIVQRGLRSETLTDPQRSKNIVHLSAVIRVVESAYYQFELGVLDKKQLAGLVGTSALHLRSEIGQLYWQTMKVNYDAGFQQFVGGLVAGARSDTVTRVLPAEPSEEG